MRFLFLLIILCGSMAHNALAQVQRCGTSERMNALQEQDGELRQRREAIETFTQHWIHEHANDASREVLTIPVVVHVVYHAEEENISDEQIFSQIEVLNEDFRAQNADLGEVPPVWADRVADCEIRFELAARTPDAQYSDGITRTYTEVDAWNGSDDVKSSAEGGKDAWDSDRYMNIWVCNIGGGLLGYAFQPGVDPEIDGIVIGHRFFGRTGENLSTTYNMGRTTTHEVGHYLNLYHLWGAGSSNPTCTLDDEVADTPLQEQPNLGCSAVFPKESCGSGAESDMFNNYMDYSNDPCMFFFTEGQKQRMRAALNGPRASLLTSNALDPPVMGISGANAMPRFSVYPNPVRNGTVTLGIDRVTVADLQLFDLQGRVVQQWPEQRLHNGQHLRFAEPNSGTYVLQMLTEDGYRAVQRIHIIR